MLASASEEKLKELSLGVLRVNVLYIITVLVSGTFTSVTTD